MSAAQNDIPSETERIAARRAERREMLRKIRKEREVKRRHVITLDDYVSWYIKENHEDLGYEVVSALVKDAVMFALNNGFLRNKAGLSDMDLAYKKHLRSLIDDEISVAEKDCTTAREGW